MADTLKDTALGLVKALRDLFLVWNELREVIQGVQGELSSLFELLGKRERELEAKGDIHDKFKATLQELTKHCSDAAESRKGTRNKLMTFFGTLVGQGAAKYIKQINESRRTLRDHLEIVSLDVLHDQAAYAKQTSKYTGDIAYVQANFVEDFVVSDDARRFWRAQFTRETKIAWEEFWTAFIWTFQKEFVAEFGERQQEIKDALKFRLDPDMDDLVRVQDYGQVFGQQDKDGHKGKRNLVQDVLDLACDPNTGFLPGHKLAGVLACAHCTNVSAMAENGSHFVSGDQAGLVKLWHVTKSGVTLEASFMGSNVEITALLLCRPLSKDTGVEGLNVVVGDAHGNVLMWDYNTQRFRESLQSSIGIASAFCTGGEKGNRVLLGSLCADGSTRICVWDLATCVRLCSYAGPSQLITSLDTVGNCMFCACHDFTVSCYDWRTGKFLNSKRLSNGVQTMTVHAKDDKAAIVTACTWDGKLHRIEMDTQTGALGDYDCKVASDVGSVLNTTSFAGHDFVVHVDHTAEQIRYFQTSVFESASDTTGPVSTLSRSGRKSFHGGAELCPTPINVLIYHRHTPSCILVLHSEDFAYIIVGWCDGQIVLYPFVDAVKDAGECARSQSASTADTDNATEVVEPVISVSDWKKVRLVISGQAKWLGLRDNVTKQIMQDGDTGPAHRSVMVQKVKIGRTSELLQQSEMPLVLEGGGSSHEAVAASEYYAMAGADTVIKVINSDHYTVTSVNMRGLYVKLAEEDSKKHRRLLDDDELSAFVVMEPDTENATQRRVYTAMKHGSVAVWTVDDAFWVTKTEVAKDEMCGHTDSKGEGAVLDKEMEVISDSGGNKYWHFEYGTFVHGAKSACEECGGAKADSHIIHVMCQTCVGSSHTKCMVCDMPRNSKRTKSVAPAPAENAERGSASQKDSQVHPVETMDEEYAICDKCYDLRKLNVRRSVVHIEEVGRGENMQVLFFKECSHDVSRYTIEWRTKDLASTGLPEASWFANPGFPEVYTRVKRKNYTLLFCASGKYSIACYKVTANSSLLNSCVGHLTEPHSLTAMTHVQMNDNEQSNFCYVLMSTRNTFLKLYRVRWDDDGDDQVAGMRFEEIGELVLGSKLVRCIRHLKTEKDHENARLVAAGDNSGVVHLVLMVEKGGDFKFTHMWSLRAHRQHVCDVFRWGGKQLCSVAGDRTAHFFPWVHMERGMMLMQAREDSEDAEDTEKSAAAVVDSATEWQFRIDGVGGWWTLNAKQIMVLSSSLDIENRMSAVVSTECGKTQVNFKTMTAKRSKTDGGREDRVIFVRRLHPVPLAGAKVRRADNKEESENRELILNSAKIVAQFRFRVRKMEWNQIKNYPENDIILYLYVTATNTPRLPVNVRFGNGSTHQVDLEAKSQHASIRINRRAFMEANPVTEVMADEGKGDFDITVELSVPSGLLVVSVYNMPKLYFLARTRPEKEWW